MRPSGQLITPYRLFWGVAIFIAALIIWLLLFVYPAPPVFTEVDPSQVTSVVAEQSPARELTLGERAGALKADVRGMDMLVRSSDGSLIMQLWAKEAAKDGDRYHIDEGVLKFMLENRDTLLLKVTDAVYQYSSGVARVTGSLVGHIPEGDQYFGAEELSWSQDYQCVTARAVKYAGPHIEVTGEEMTIDLGNGRVSFAGAVEASI